MEIIIKNSISEIGETIAKEIAHHINLNPKTILGLATGSSPVEVYQALIKLNKANVVSFKDVKSFNLDEYLGEVDFDKTYRFFMNEELFKHIDINLSNTHFPSIHLLDKYDEAIEEAGGIDIQLLGIGQNGHIAFNEPGTAFYSKTHVVTLAEKTRQDNSRFFESLDKVPTHAVTMGLSTIMKAKEIIMIVYGDNKVETLKTLMSTKEDEHFPASILVSHPNVKIFTTLDLYNRAIR